MTGAAGQRRRGDVGVDTLTVGCFTGLAVRFYFGRLLHRWWP
jgi:hypothetical protein